MILGCFKISSIIFKAFCGVAVGFMVGFWMVKYHENEDVSAIEYVSYKTQTDIAYPVPSLCTFMPFIHPNLFWNSSIQVSGYEYNRYIHGLTALREEYEGMIFDNVTLNLLEYVQNIVILTRNKIAARKIICNSLENCPYAKFKINYDGTMRGLTLRCAGFEIDQESLGQVDLLTMVFEPGLSDILHDVGNTFLVLNYPGQVLKSLGSSQQIWKKPHEPSRLIIKVRTMEILRRRSKNNKACLADWEHYDEMVLKQHDNSLKCRPPYRKSGKPLCKTKRELKDSVYELDKMRSSYDTEPCKEMSSIVFGADQIIYALKNESLKFTYRYPEKTKIIQQIKSVDLHALIGNIGGYIGLFLGKELYLILL